MKSREVGRKGSQKKKETAKEKDAKKRGLGEEDGLVSSFRAVKRGCQEQDMSSVNGSE